MEGQKIQRRRRPFSSLSSCSTPRLSGSIYLSVNGESAKTRSPSTLPKSADFSDRPSNVDRSIERRKSRTPPLSSSGKEFLGHHTAETLAIPYVLSLQGDTPREDDENSAAENSAAKSSSVGSSSSESLELPVSKIAEESGEGQRLPRNQSFSPRAGQFMLKISSMCTKVKKASSEIQHREVSHDSVKRANVRETQSSPFTSCKEMRKREDLPNSSDEEEFCAMVKSLSRAVKEEYSCKQEEIDKVVMEATSPAMSRKSEKRLHRSESVESREMSSVSSEKRRNVYLEILNTEKNFIADLQKLVALRSRIMVSALLSKGQLEKFIPRTLVQLLELHSSIMEAVENDKMTIANAFVILMEDNAMNLYVNYCKKYSKCVERCHKLVDKDSSYYCEGLVKLLKRREYTTSFVEGVLISPIQRITRYLLLFGEYRKVCEKEKDITSVKKVETILEGFEELVLHMDKKTGLS